MTQYIIKDSCFEGDEFDSASEIENAIVEAINNGALSISDAEDLEVCELVPVICTVEVSVSVSIA